MNHRVSVLIVEDDDAIRRGVVGALEYAGYAALEACDGEEGLKAAFGAGVDLLLLDLALPRMDGMDVLKEVRKGRPGLPVIILTARSAEDDRVRGLREGADDYVVKPFSARELLARVEAVLRRSAERPRPVARLKLGGREVDLERREVVAPGGGVEPLTEREGALLAYLAANAGRAISRDEILSRVWGIDPRNLDTRAVDMAVARLREKLGDVGGAPKLVLTVRGQGYALARPACSGQQPSGRLSLPTEAAP
ncbi:MAG TPA: response regulator transcription factor [Candidatus Brocadiia bacterium]|nr:response regulator transcription factor [Candidatus Brocadiia bacterium]